MSHRLHRPESLHALVRDMVVKAGWTQAEAKETADHLVLANLSGHDSHGIGMLPLYFQSLADGNLDPQARPETRVDAAPFLIIDGKVALGQPNARNAVDRAVTMAQSGGVAIVNLLDSHHIGRIGHYAEVAAEAGLISFFWVNVAGRPPIVAPYAAKEARFGTNPHAIGIPVPGGDPLILDFATSRMAHGKARVALNKGEQVPPGYIIDGEGRPTTDPAHVFASPDHPLGALLPFGDHKGAGLSLIAELLSAGLMGAARIDQKPQRTWVINSLFGIIIDPARLEPDAELRRSRTESYLAFVRAAKPMDPANPVLAPGDKERKVRIERQAAGIPLDDETWSQIVAAARRHGLDAESY
ncbi:malate/lactate/ureidoglycolate dehydrogenase [Bosea sp. ANAM02]|uniref:malate/lactate/ureidoglycolate dehydrogenase n=1 Tax=Bosea sp. ANAM02 TaxID=2020412 RepID=UPI00140EC384|nr:malate/lactate/ureidoglycolate dehydrogenase [Bosea sp. ANAM02]BCB20093.1 malate/lactate/ureidoglycolate dehydrogenase [Bosea sp. ANAM02]